MSRAPAVGRGYAVAALGLVGLAGAGAVAAAFVEEGLAGAAWRLTAVSVILFAVTLVVSLLGPRRDLVPPDRSGSVVVRAPLLLVGSLVGAWLLLLAAAAVWVLLMTRDFSQVDPAGPIVVVVLGSLCSLPYLARLATGRLHRWEVRMTTDGLTYQGWRDSVSEPWTAVRGARVNRGRGPGVVVDLKASRPDLVIPATAFLVHPEALADEIRARAR